MFIEHELATVRVTGEHERELRCRIENMRMMCEQNRECIRASELRDIGHGPRVFCIVMRPANAEHLQLLTFHREGRCLIAKERQTRPQHLPTKTRSVLKEIVIPFTQEDTMPGPESTHQVDAR